MLGWRTRSTGGDLVQMHKEYVVADGLLTKRRQVLAEYTEHERHRSRRVCQHRAREHLRDYI